MNTELILSFAKSVFIGILNCNGIVIFIMSDFQEIHTLHSVLYNAMKITFVNKNNTDDFELY